MNSGDEEQRELAIMLAKEAGVQEGIKAIYEAGMRRGWKLGFDRGTVLGKSMLTFWSWEAGAWLVIGGFLGAGVYAFLDVVEALPW